MKPHPILLLLISAFCFSSNLKAQTAPAYQKIVLTEYHIVGTGSNQSVKINDVMEITGNSMHRMTKTYRGVCDTVYQLNDQTVSILNSVFNGKKPLKSFMKSTKMPDGHHYGGYPAYLNYTDKTGKSQQLFIVESFMDDDFIKIFDTMTRLQFPITVKYKGDKIINDALEHEISSNYKKATYVPNTELPPSMSMPPPGQ